MERRRTRETRVKAGLHPARREGRDKGNLLGIIHRLFTTAEGKGFRFFGAEELSIGRKRTQRTQKKTFLIFALFAFFCG
jgi:hypothetical protein